MQLRRAGRGDEQAVLGILDEASAWLHARGIRQWPHRWSPDHVRTVLDAGETWLAEVDGEPIGTVTLQWVDSLWSDVDEPPDVAGYVHRLAVRRSAPGAGRALLDWAGATTREHGRGLLRLDCVAHNTRLRAYYEASGFRPRGEVEVQAPPGPRRSSGTRVIMARYELALTPGATSDAGPGRTSAGEIG